MRAVLALGLVAFCACASDPTSGVDGSGDLTIQYVRRLPAIDFVAGSQNPAVEGWPAVGQMVTWRAHIKNWFAESQAVRVEWFVDGVSVREGTVTVPGGGVATADYEWAWTFDRYELRVEIEGEAPEAENANNSLVVHTNAISVGFWVERGLYDHFRQNQPRLQGAGSTCFEDWAQRQIRMYNSLLFGARFPETPDGVLDRYRLDRITIVDDGALPLNPSANAIIDAIFSVTRGEPLNQPNSAAAYIPDLGDRTVDLQWGFPSTEIGAYNDHSNIPQNPAFYSGFVQHELGHARYLIDEYPATVHDGLPGHVVDIEEDGVRVAGTAHMPASPVISNGVPGSRLYQAPPGLMSSEWTFLDRFSAVMLNRVAGQRARFRNYYFPSDVGVFFEEMPGDNRLIVTNQAGDPLPGATVSVYRAKRFEVPGRLLYGRRFAEDPDVVLTANGSGEVSLGPNPFVENGDPLLAMDSRFSNVVIAVRVEWEGLVGFGFVPVYDFLIEYQVGRRDVGRARLAVALR